MPFCAWQQLENYKLVLGWIAEFFKNLDIPATVPIHTQLEAILSMVASGVEQKQGSGSARASQPATVSEATLLDETAMVIHAGGDDLGGAQPEGLEILCSGGKKKRSESRSWSRRWQESFLQTNWLEMFVHCANLAIHLTSFRNASGGRPSLVLVEFEDFASLALDGEEQHSLRAAWWLEMGSRDAAWCG